jgi:hypothetical protein
MLPVETRRLQARLLPELAVVLAGAWGLLKLSTKLSASALS